MHVAAGLTMFSYVKLYMPIFHFTTRNGVQINGLVFFLLLYSF